MQVTPNHKIVFGIGQDGELFAEVEGVQGKGCEGLLDILAELGFVTSEEHTDDYDKPEPQGITQAATAKIKAY